MTTVKDADESSRSKVAVPKATASIVLDIVHHTTSTPKSKASKDKPHFSATAVDVPMETEDFVDNSKPAVSKSMTLRSRVHVAKLSVAAGKTDDPLLELSQSCKKTMIDDAPYPQHNVDDVAIRCPTFSDIEKLSSSKVPVPKTTNTGDRRTSSTPKSKTSNGQTHFSPTVVVHGDFEMDDEDSLSLQDFDNSSSDDWEPPMQERFAIQSFSVGNTAIPSGPTTSDAGVQHANARTLANRKTGLRAVNGLENENDGDGLYRNKYHDLLEKYHQKCKAYKEMKKKNEKQLLKIAEMKDLIVFANAEAKKALADPHAKVIFTTDSEIGISIQQIEEVNAVSKSDIQFGQNLALFFYGANTLREMSVKGVATHRFKNAKARPGISPKKLAFIHEKVQQRVAARVGANNLAIINALANSTLINKGIGEKIANLNKAVRLSAARNALRDAELNPNLAAKD